MQRYANRDGSSGVVAYATGPAGIAVEFTNGAIYVYDLERPGRQAVSEMKRLARQGRGLSTYISQHVRDCYAKNPDEWYLADGCGQFNVFEVVNDNNQYKNLDVFSTNFFGYAGYVGEGPCGPACSVASLSGAVDLIDRAHDTEAAAGATAGPAPQGGPGAAFRRPVSGYRYFVVLLDVATRQVQLGVIHPRHIPGALAPLLPALPAVIPQSAVDDLLALRLPR